jgi:hypothetical protein
MKPLRLEPFTFVLGLTLIFGIAPISTYLGQALTPQNPNFAWWIPVSIAGGVIILVSLVLGTALSKESAVSKYLDQSPH